jgi:hypothetical protein
LTLEIWEISRVSAKFQGLKGFKFQLETLV